MIQEPTEGVPELAYGENYKNQWMLFPGFGIQMPD
jgi:hypothetical protein